MKVDQALIVGYDGTIHFAANTNKGKEKEAKSSARKGQKSTDPDNETPAPPCDGKIEEEGTVIEPTHDASLWVDTNGFDHFLNRSRIYDYVSAHVANGSEQTIWVKCDTNRDYVLEESVKLSDEIEKGLVSRLERLFSVSMQNAREDEPKLRTRTCTSSPSLEASLKSLVVRRFRSNRRRSTALPSSLRYTKSKKMVRFCEFKLFGRLPTRLPRSQFR